MRISIFRLVAALGLAATCFAGESSTSGGAVFIPLDSWIYPALERVAALGFIPDQNSDLAPWTRAECARQVAEATARIQNAPDASGVDEALRLVHDLTAECPVETTRESKQVTLESIYTGFTAVAGTPLDDSYHFGQTITDNFGRPYEKGLNNDTGVSGYGQYGHFFAYFRGEYQYAPSAPADDLAVRQFIALADSNPLQPATPMATTNRFTLLDTYVGAQFGLANISFGKESFWSGPGADSAFSLSDNAAPFYTLNLSQSHALVLPGFLRYLGKMHSQFLFGELEGHNWPRRPQINSQKVSFDVTRDLEVGFTRSVFWGGVGHPITLGSFWSSLASLSSTGTTFTYGDRTDPGDRHGGFDFRYRVPGLRHYVTIYSDSYADDDPSPLANPSRAAWGPGIYISQLPYLSHLDLRFETYSTEMYSGDKGGQFVYFNNQYHDSYTNSGDLLGSYVGRDARAYVASAGYWLTGRSRFEAQYRQTKDGSQFLPGGGTQTDASIYLQWGIGRKLLLTAAAQAERYYIPILGPSREDAVAMLSMTYSPHLVAAK